MSYGIYIHFPFCAKRCAYCDFVSTVGALWRCGDYAKAVRREIQLYAAKLGRLPVCTIYMGGGTPSLLPADCIATVLEAARQHFQLSPNCEITLEANPCSATLAKLQALRAAGVNRVSLGVQTLQPQLLQRIGRLHSPQQALRALEAAQLAGFASVSADLLYGLPGQTLGDHLSSINAVVTAGVQHLSAYSLKLEKGAPLLAAIQAGECALPGEDVEFSQYRQGIRRLESLGFARYEVSNFALPGHACRHNLGYWRNGYYLGLGVAAHGCLPGAAANLRYCNTDSLDDYIADLADGRLPLLTSAAVPPKEAMFETMMLGLRTAEGVDRTAFVRRYGRSITQEYGPILEKLCAQGYLQLTSTHLLPTERGLDFHNTVSLAFCVD